MLETANLLSSASKQTTTTLNSISSSTCRQCSDIELVLSTGQYGFSLYSREKEEKIQLPTFTVEGHQKSRFISYTHIVNGVLRATFKILSVKAPSVQNNALEILVLFALWHFHQKELLRKSFLCHWNSTTFNIYSNFIHHKRNSCYRRGLTIWLLVCMKQILTKRWLDLLFVLSYWSTVTI